MLYGNTFTVNDEEIKRVRDIFIKYAESYKIDTDAKKPTLVDKHGNRISPRKMKNVPAIYTNSLMGNTIYVGSTLNMFGNRLRHQIRAYTNPNKNYKNPEKKNLFSKNVREPYIESFHKKGYTAEGVSFNILNLDNLPPLEFNFIVEMVKKYGGFLTVLEQIIMNDVIFDGKGDNLLNVKKPIKTNNIYRSSCTGKFVDAIKNTDSTLERFFDEL